MKIVNPNEHIEKYLEYYLSLDRPGYAVMIKGDWGTGKTWFIKNFIKKHDVDNKKSIYISLNSISSIAGIENEFFKKLHPFLSSKGFQIVSNILSGAIKTAVNIDINNDGKSDGNISASFSKCNLVNMLNKFEGDIIIFDDVERCSIPINELFGYINSFIEHDSFKVILVAHECEIKTLSDNALKEGYYKKIKEKIIGKTFEVLPNSSSAIQLFINEIQNKKTASIIKPNKGLIVAIYDASMCKNLRVLRHALQDASSFFIKIKDEYLMNNEFVLQLINIYFIYYIEILTGNISPCELVNFQSSIFWTIKLQNNDSVKDDKYFMLIQKYDKFNIHNNILEYSTWQSFYEKGLIDFDTINSDISKSVYFVYDAQPEWIRLWKFTDLSDSEFDKYLEMMISKWKKKEYCELGEIFHVSGILFTLSENNLIKFDGNYIKSHSMECIKDLRGKKILHKYFSEPSQFFIYNRNAWGGLGYHSYEHADFIKLRECADKEILAAKQDVYKSVADKIITVMSSDINEFKKILILTSDGPNIYHDVPIMQFVNVKDFCDAYIKLSSKNKQVVSSVFATRYDRNNFKSSLSEDMEFIINLSDFLGKQLCVIKGQVSKYLIDKFVNNTLANIINDN